MSIVVVILAGGQGTRFWPASRSDLPKQFLKLDGGEQSMICSTAKRLSSLSEEKPFVITGKSYLELVKEHLPDSRVICEPVGRNTAPAIALAALKVEQYNPGATMLVLPSDHTVQYEDKLQAALLEAAKIAEQDLLVTIGIKPSSPHTGYGYIQVGDLISGASHKVKRFYEKPNLERATKYLESGDYYWNSGMFVWKASSILREIKSYMPSLHDELMKIKAVLGTESEDKVTEEVFNNIESQSIDFGVLEHSKSCAVVVAEDFGWSDVGSWDAWASLFPKDDSKNFISGKGVFLESENCIASSDTRFMAVLGCQDIAVIDAGDVVLVCHKDKLQDIKKVIAWLKSNDMTELV